MKKIVKKIVVILFVLLLIFAIIVFAMNVAPHSVVYNEHLHKRDGFGYLNYFTLEHKMSEEDKVIAEEIIETARTVFEYQGNKEDADKSVGALAIYYKNGVVSSKIELELITADFSKNSGYMWVVYSKAYVHEYADGTTGRSGAPNVLTYWKVEKIDGSWIVTDVNDSV